MSATESEDPAAERWRALEPLLDAALALTPTQRRAFLEQACAEDDAMRAEVEAMAAECDQDAAHLATRQRPGARNAPTATVEQIGQLREALADRYELQEEIGRGGMATVFAARDLKHDRAVALKVIHPEASATLGADRFLREIAIAARLSHPNILPLYDSGAAAGLLYYVTPRVEGGSLREHLRAERQLPLDEAVRIATEVCAALDGAHRRGVVHRDIKPENILLQEGCALVADFGIARAVSHMAASTLTPASTSLGTPAYMSPEQATSSHDADGRADLYALGCVLYEMLAGQQPYAGPSAASIISQHVAAAIPSARTLRATVPPALDLVIRRAMAKSPADRYGTGAELAAALRVALTGDAAPAPGEHATIAVLPFVNLSADPENEYFSDGVTEEILGALARIPALRVASRQSSFAFKGQKLTTSEIGERLGVRTVLEGSLRRSGNRIRLSVQLTNAMDGYTLWSERYDRELQDVFAIQEDIARTIVDTLRLKLTSAEQHRLAKRHTDDLEAYELYLRGRYCWHHRGMLRKSMGYFQKALEKDPEFALAYHGLADGYCVLGLYGFAPPSAVVPAARRLLQRAVALAPELAEVHTSQGFLLLLTWEWDAAERALCTAIRLNPNYALAHSFHAWLLTTVGREAEAIAAAARAQELDPESSVTNGIGALVAYHARNYPRAIAECERALDAEPSDFLSRLAITLSYSASGDYASALAHAAEGVRLSPDAMFLRGLLGAVHGMAGEYDKADETLVDLRRRAQSVYVAPILLSWIHAHSGQVDRAFDCLEEAYAERSCPLGFGVRFPIYDGIRSDPRFERLLQRMDLR
ncbi:MAG TPA: protein kinase [Gemmatimonadaceae bacterium]|nr:protein kinase [Gemmatimonadaceae bacterium]